MKIIELLKSIAKAMKGSATFDTIGIKLPTSEYNKAKDELSEYAELSVSLKSHNGFEGYSVRAYGVKFLIEEL